MIYEPLYILSLKHLLVIISLLLFTKYTSGIGAVLIALYGLYNAYKRQHIQTLLCFCLLSMMSILNPIVFGFGSLLSLSTRLGIPCMTLTMFMDASLRNRKIVVPLQSIFLFIIIAALCSLVGYAPIISILKIVNFVMFIGGICLSTKMLSDKTEELGTLRAFFFALSLLIVLGSLLLYFVNPFAAYYSSYGWYIAREGLDAAKHVMETQVARTGEAGYFCGILNHSQCLGPTVACIAGWLLCDMLFVEKRIMFVHILLFCLCPLELYKTASRTSLLAFFVAVMVIFLYSVPQLRISSQLKRRLRLMIIAGLFVLTVSGIILEYRNNGMTNWLNKSGNMPEQKNNNVTIERLTSSRQGVIAESFQDFIKSPILGMGFQVSKKHEILAKSKIIVLSVPVEKGFLPTMVLGETGILGAFAFLFFLFQFYHECIRREYLSMLALFTTMLASNLGEATFFSPGGLGGMEWLFAIVGGLIVDMTCQYSLKTPPVCKQSFPYIKNYEDNKLLC